MIVRAATERPMIFALTVLDRQIIDAGNAPPHQTTGFYEPPLRTVSSQGGTIYERPDTQSRVLGFLPAGRQVSFIGSVGNWAHVVANGIDGFVITSQLR